MFSYYGSKSKIVDLYPKPKHGKIIEPFAGSARYSLKWFENDVTIYDIYPEVVRVWKYLQQASEADVMGLPSLRMGDDIRDHKQLSDDERLFLGFMAGVSGPTPRWKVSYFASEHLGRKETRGEYIKVAEKLHRIRHWDIICGDYRGIENERATWFIDPPYQTGGQAYKFNKINYSHLSAWSKARVGQVIVCEGGEADWMPFSLLRKSRSGIRVNTEVVWMSEVEDYPTLQGTLL